MDKWTQEELEQPVKGWQIFALTKDLNSLMESSRKELDAINRSLNSINSQTKGVVTYKQMEEYVEKRIDEKTKPLWELKANNSKFVWLIVGLIITTVGSRLL